MANPQVIQGPQRRSGEVAQFGVITLGLEFTDNHDRDDDFVLGEASQRRRICQQDTGVYYIRLAPFILALCHEVLALSVDVVLLEWLPSASGITLRTNGTNTS